MPTREHTSVLANVVSRKDSEIASLKERNGVLETDLFRATRKQELPIPVVGLELGDPEPTNADERKMYVSRVAQFHHEVLGPKILALISDARGQFEQINRELFGFKPAEYDLFLKGTINGLWLIHGFGESMVNEQLANQQESAEAVSDAELQSLKEAK